MRSSPLAGAVETFPLFSHLICSIHLKPTHSLHCAQSVVVLSFNDRLPFTTPPSFFLPRYRTRHWRTAPLLAKNYSSIHPFVESRPFRVSACRMHAPELAPFLCTRFFFVYIFHLRLLDTFFLSVYGTPPACPSSFFFSLYGQTNLKNIKPNTSISRQPIFFFSFHTFFPNQYQ
jgi:hypothetical protein